MVVQLSTVTVHIYMAKPVASIHVAKKILHYAQQDLIRAGAGPDHAWLCEAQGLLRSEQVLFHILEQALHSEEQDLVRAGAEPASRGGGVSLCD